MPFQHEILIPFHFTDGAGILFFGHIFTLAHQTFEAYVIKELKIPWREWFQNKDWTVPIKQTEACYHRPLLAGQPCLILLEVTEIKITSLVIQYRFYQEQVECGTVKIIHVFCDRVTGKKRTIPELIRLSLLTRSYSQMTNCLDSK